MSVPSACNCCSEPPCGEPLLDCQSWSASRSKRSLCGQGYEGVVYRTKKECGDGQMQTTSYTLDDSGVCNSSTDSSNNINCCYGFVGPGGIHYSVMTIVTTYTGSTSGSFTQISTINSDCSSTYSGSGSAYDSVSHIAYNWDDSTHGWTYTTSDGHTYPSDHGPGGGDGGVTTYSGAITPPDVDFSDPDTGETTGDLITATEGALPTDPNGSGCMAYAHLESGENSYSIAKAQTRVVHYPTGNCYLKVWLTDTRVLTDGSGSTTTVMNDAVGPYEWIGSGNPCVTDPTKAYDDAANQISGPWYDLATPSVEAGQEITVTRAIRKWSCVQDYEPDDTASESGYAGSKPNGYPIPS